MRGVSCFSGALELITEWARARHGGRILIHRPEHREIYGQNIGLLTSTDFGLIPRILAGEPIGIDEFTAGLDPINADIVRHGGLFAYNKARLIALAMLKRGGLLPDLPRLTHG